MITSSIGTCDVRGLIIKQTDTPICVWSLVSKEFRCTVVKQVEQLANEFNRSPLLKRLIDLESQNWLEEQNTKQATNNDKKIKVIDNSYINYSKVVRSVYDLSTKLVLPKKKQLMWSDLNANFLEQEYVKYLEGIVSNQLFDLNSKKADSNSFKEEIINIESWFEDYKFELTYLSNMELKGDYEGNPFTSMIPLELQHCMNLTSLQICDYGDSSLENLHVLSKLSSLKSLEFGNVSINEFSTDFKQLTHLTICKIDSCTLLKPETLLNFPYLQTFEWSGFNDGESVPSVVFEISSLTSLAIKNFNLSDLSKFTQLINLQNLVLMNNNLTEFPTVVTTLPYMKKLELWIEFKNDKITEIPHSINEMIEIKIEIIN